MKHKGAIYIFLILFMLFLLGYLIYTGNHVGEVTVNGA